MGGDKGESIGNLLWTGDGNDDEEEDDEFDGDGCDDYLEDDDNDDDEDDDLDENEDESSDDGNDVILMGHIHLNEGGHVVYSGTWAFRRDLANNIKNENKKGSDNNNSNNKKSDSNANVAVDDDDNEEKGDKGGKKKKSNKFKLRSKRTIDPSRFVNLFQRKALSTEIVTATATATETATETATATVMEKTTTKNKPASSDSRSDGGSSDDPNPPKTSSLLSSSIPPLSLLFDGFLTMRQDEEQHRKVKERDVEIIFETTTKDKDGQETIEGKRNDPRTSESITKVVVRGSGCNEYGRFELNGTYIPEKNTHNVCNNEIGDGDNGGDDSQQRYSLECVKRYDCDDKKSSAAATSSSTMKRKRSRNDYSDDDEDDEDDGMSDDNVGADYEELIGLHEEAGMSVEELRKRYYGGDDVDGGNIGGNDTGTTNSDHDTRGGRGGDGVIEDDGDDGCGF